MAQSLKNILYAIAGSILIIIFTFITLRGQVLNSKADWADVKELNNQTVEYVDKQDSRIEKTISVRLQRIELQNDELIRILLTYSNENKK